MQLSALATLVAILDKGSFAAAAAAVGCTPSAVSLQVRQLEAWFGRPLFDRSARSARPTPFAHEAAAAARAVDERLRGLRTPMRLAVGGRVRLGAIASVQTDALPQVLRQLRDQHPQLALEISLNDSDTLQAELKAGTIDAAALVRPPSGGSSRLVWHELHRQPFALLRPQALAGATARELLLTQPWIRYDPALTGGRIAAQLVRRLNPRAACAMQLRSIDAIVAMVSAGLGVAVVPQPREALLRAHGVAALALGRGSPSRRIALARRKSDADDRNLDAVRRAFAAVYAAQHRPG